MAMPPSRPGAPGASALSPRAPGMLGQVLGNRMPRYSRLLDKLNQGSTIFKVPTNFGADEHNVMFGLGTTAALAAGASAALSQNAPRDLILRKLVVYNVASVVDGNFFLSAVTVEGNALLLGAAYPGGSFLPGAFHTPEFDIPVAGGTPVAVTITNGAGVGVTFSAGFLID